MFLEVRKGEGVSGKGEGARGGRWEEEEGEEGVEQCDQCRDSFDVLNGPL